MTLRTLEPGRHSDKSETHLAAVVHGAWGVIRNVRGGKILLCLPLMA